jgi:hypothetical protein
MKEGRGVDTGKLFVGILLVTFGLLFLFDRMFWLDLGDVLRLWPLWLIAFGIARVAFPGRGRHGRPASRLAGFWPIVIGAIFLMDTLDVMHLGESWPLFIVSVGVLMVLRAMGVGECRTEARG